MDEDLFSRADRGGDGGGGGDNLFAWTIAILLLIGFALACWVASFYVFGNPEKPFSYSMLNRLGKLDPPKRYELTSAPKGEFLTAQQLYERFSGMPEFELKTQNDTLFRAYLRNYTDKSVSVPYAMGTFNILDSYELTGADRFPSGVVALAQSADFPAVLIEHVYSAESNAVPVLKRMLMTGLDLRLRRTFDLSAVVRITRLGDGRLLFTLVPLLYGSYTLSEGSAALRLDPPTHLNVEAPWPLVNMARLAEADAKYGAFRKDAGLPAVAITPMPVATPTPAPVAQATPTPAPVAEVVPVATPLPATTPFAASTPPESLAAATPPAAPPVPVATPLPADGAPPAATPIPVATPLTTPFYAGVAEPEATAAGPGTSEVAPSGVPLKPFIASAPEAGPAGTAPATSSQGAWTLYEPGRMPSGRLLDTQAAAGLADRGTGGSRLYLEGDFAVTVSGGNRAILRPRGRSLFGGNTRVRVIADYPQGVSAPVEGATVARGEMRPFEITDIRRGADGEVNVYVREITRP